MRKYIIIIGILLLTQSCISRRSYLGTYYSTSIRGKGSKDSISLLEGNRFIYNSSFHGKNYCSSGKFDVRNRTLVFYSDLTDSVIPMEVSEISDTGKTVYEWNFAESNHPQNVCNGVLTTYGSSVVHYLCFCETESVLEIADTNNRIINAFAFTFPGGMHTNQYHIKNSKSKTFVVLFEVSCDIENYQFLNNRRSKIRRNKIILEKAKFVRY